MDRALSGFLVGFFLAVFLMAAAIKIELGPLEPALNTAISASQVFSDITHSAVYSDITDLVRWVNTTVDTAAQTPLIGGLMPSEIPVTTSQLLALLESAKEFSNELLAGLKFMLFIVQISVPAMILSLLLGGYGAYTLYTESQEGSGGRREKK